MPYRIDIRPSQEFGYSSAVNKLIALDIPSTHEQRLQFLVPHGGLVDSTSDQLGIENVGFTLQEGKMLHLSSSIDMENTITVGCAGAIVTYLQRRRTVELGSEDRGLRVKSVEMFGLESTM